MEKTSRCCDGENCAVAWPRVPAPPVPPVPPPPHISPAPASPSIYVHMHVPYRHGSCQGSLSTTGARGSCSEVHRCPLAIAIACLPSDVMLICALCAVYRCCYAMWTACTASLPGSLLLPLLLLLLLLRLILDLNLHPKPHHVLPPDQMTMDGLVLAHRPVPAPPNWPQY